MGNAMNEATSQASNNRTHEQEERFAKDIEKAKATQVPAKAKLYTDDRVLARITDGIYRQPASALRELISNAFDADATEVYIDTDAPRFSQIRVRDNGRGMNAAVLTRLIHHIGGSSKRTTVGGEIGTTNPEDPSLSPGGRRLIGKIGIGLFSVSQLTSHFQVITKVKGDGYRLVADVVLRTYSEGEVEPGDGTFETGSVEVVPMKAEDVDSHGTEIILLDIRRRVRDLLQSRDRWAAILGESDESNSQEAGETQPIWHAGLLERHTNSATLDMFQIDPNLPWKVEDAPRVRFQKLFEAVANEVDATVSRPDLAKSLDAYLATLWSLSLSAPVEYLTKHPFDITKTDNVYVYELINGKRGQAKSVELAEGQTVREAMGLHAGVEDPMGDFNVFVDEVQLLRPMSLQYWPTRKQAVDRPMLFVGRYNPDLSAVPSEIRGGDLAFESYFFWNSKIVPKEIVGVLVRINGASGALYDDTFMKYQVSEQTRLRQITSEIFVSEGMDAALNIDRESFNFAHPHYQIVSNWVHRSLRQITNTHKAIGDSSRAQIRAAEREVATSRLDSFALKTWSDIRKDDESAPEVVIMESKEEVEAHRASGSLAFERAKIPAVAQSGTSKPTTLERSEILKAMAKILEAYGVFEGMSFARQHSLLNALLAVYFEDAQG